MTKEKNNTPFKTVVQNLEFVDFEANPKFIGKYENTVEVGEGEKHFTANIFTDIETSEQVYIGNSYSIEKAIKAGKTEYPKDFSNLVFQIEFKGKTEVNGKPFNQFVIGYCTLSDYEAFVK